MNTWNDVSRKWRAARSPAVFGAAMALAACGGGGVTTAPDDGGGGGGPSVNATPYTLFASNYVAYASQTNGAFLHSVQGGDVYASFGGNINYGCYSFPQSQMNATQFYAIQAQADSNGGSPPNYDTCQSVSNVPPTTAADFAGVSIKAPGTNSPTATSVAPLDISQSTTMLVQMGNIYTQGDVPGAIGGNATVYTVELNNDTSFKQDGSGQTALCSFDQTLATIGRGPTAPLGVLNYVIPFSSFTCSKGTMDTMKSTGVTTVTIRYSGDKNPNLKVNELDVIAVGYVGFSK
jgi:hypothetical protein